MQDAYHSLMGIPNDPALLAEYPFFDNISEEDQEVALGHWSLLLQGIPTEFEMQLKPRGDQGKGDGTWFLTACVPVMDDNGTVFSVVGCVTDISAQKRSQAEARARAEALERAEASELRFKRFTDLSPVAISIKDADYKVSRFSSQNLSRYPILTSPDNVLQR